LLGRLSLLRDFRRLGNREWNMQRGILLSKTPLYQQLA